MNKEDLGILASFWEMQEQALYHKAKHLQTHVNEWNSEHGIITSDHPDYPSICRLLEAASKAKECDHD